MAVAAGWYDDPYKPGCWRWYDGNQWTEHVHPGTNAGAEQTAEHQTNESSAEDTNNDLARTKATQHDPSDNSDPPRPTSREIVEPPRPTEETADTESRLPGVSQGPAPVPSPIDVGTSAAVASASHRRSVTPSPSPQAPVSEPPPEQERPSGSVGSKLVNRWARVRVSSLDRLSPAPRPTDGENSADPIENLPEALKEYVGEPLIITSLGRGGVRTVLLTDYPALYVHDAGSLMSDEHATALVPFPLEREEIVFAATSTIVRAAVDLPDIGIVSFDYGDQLGLIAAALPLAGPERISPLPVSVVAGFKGGSKVAAAASRADGHPTAAALREHLDGGEFYAHVEVDHSHITLTKRGVALCNLPIGSLRTAIAGRAIHIQAAARVAGLEVESLSIHLPSAELAATLTTVLEPDRAPARPRDIATATPYEGPPTPTAAPPSNPSSGPVPEKSQSSDHATDQYHQDLAEEGQAPGDRHQRGAPGQASAIGRVHLTGVGTYSQPLDGSAEAVVTETDLSLTDTSTDTGHHFSFDDPGLRGAWTMDRLILLGAQGGPLLVADIESHLLDRLSRHEPLSRTAARSLEQGPFLCLLDDGSPAALTIERHHIRLYGRGEDRHEPLRSLQPRPVPATQGQVDLSLDDDDPSLTLSGPNQMMEAIHTAIQAAKAEIDFEDRADQLLDAIAALEGDYFLSTIVAPVAELHALLHDTDGATLSRRPQQQAQELSDPIVAPEGDNFVQLAAELARGAAETERQIEHAVLRLPVFLTNQDSAVVDPDSAAAPWLKALEGQYSLALNSLWPLACQLAAVHEPLQDLLNSAGTAAPQIESGRVREARRAVECSVERWNHLMAATLPAVTQQLADGLSGPRQEVTRQLASKSARISSTADALNQRLASRLAGLQTFLAFPATPGTERSRQEIVDKLKQHIDQLDDPSAFSPF